ncbi:MAG: hypothetical protein ACLR53_10370, partial [Evtepia gabavorous]
QNDDLLAFRQLRAQAARKKQLETQRAALTDRCQVLSVQAEACRKARQAAEQEVATLESKGPMGLLYTIAGDKAKRLDEARQTLRKARADDQQASWDLAQAQVDLAQTSVPWNRWPAVTAPLPPPGRPGPQPSKPLTCPKAASYVSWKRPLPRGKIGSNVSPICAPSAVPSWTRPGKPSVWPSAWNSFAPPPPLPFCRTRPI